ncbi:MAG TPA: cytochrome c [Casimicrobiaceae bacterium]|nr:cytochrome c [Casimicrobiaceae bacterium]
MKRNALAWTLCAGTLVAAGAATAAEKVDVGKSEYDVSCAVCHGISGDGNGPYKPSLAKAPSNLTRLAKNNAGTFPFEHVYQVIDGRIRVEGHGPSDMPIWGDRYTVRAAEHYVDVPYEPERFVRARILAVTEYVSRLQAK